jgi:hypothetical protein
MAQIVVETDQAVFKFDAQLVIDHLQHLSRDHNRPDLQRCIDEISSDKAPEIKVQSSHSWFGIVALELLEQGKGHVLCKSCSRVYEPGSLWCASFILPLALKRQISFPQGSPAG